MKIFVCVSITFTLFAGTVWANMGRAVYTKDHPEGPSLHVEAGPFTIRFAQKTSWTFRETHWSGVPIFVPSGFMQPVVNEAGVPPGKDMFLGTGHRGEKILSVELQSWVGAKTNNHQVVEGLAVQEADGFMFVKKSRFESEWNGPLYEHLSRVTILSEEIREQYSFTALSAGCTNVTYVYVFMHIFTNSTRAWAVGDDTGRVFDRGEFGDDGSFSLRRDIKFAMVHNPSANVGTVIFYPETYIGRKGFQNSFWNRAYDNKLYFQIEPKRSPGESFAYECTTKVYRANKGEFESKGLELMTKQMLPATLPWVQQFSFDKPETFKLNPGESLIPDEDRGAYFEIVGNGAYRFRKFPLLLEPVCQYRISGSIRKATGVSPSPSHAMVAVINYTLSNELEVFATLGGSAPCDGRWHRFEGMFTTSSNLTERAGLVLYNVNSTSSVCFDEISIEKNRR